MCPDPWRGGEAQEVEDRPADNRLLSAVTIGDAGASVSAAENKRYAVPASACHYNGRTDGSATIDHELPWKFAGMGVINIVRCCQICNSIKAVRPYAWFIPFMGQFHELDADEYRAGDPR